MHATNSCLSSVSRRTRSHWDAFYRSQYDVIKKKPDQEDATINNGECASNYDTENQDFETKNARFVTTEGSEESSDEEGYNTADDSYKKNCKLKKSCKYEGTRKVGRPPMKNKKTRINIQEHHVIDMLVESIWKEKDLTKEKPVCDEGNNAVSESTLPMKFSLDFGKKGCLPGKTEWEKEIDSLFDDLEMGLWESEVGSAYSSMSDDECVIISDTNETRAARCNRGEHDGVLDEQIGIVCKYCNALLLDIKYVLPDFYVESPEKRERKDSDQSQPSIMNQIQFQDSTCSSTLESSLCSKGTVLDLIPQSDKELYPHQLEGFEFLWRNIAGDINIKNLEKLPSDCGRGCIISHAPGTGKTRLTIVFLQTFMKLYPQCRPLIIAPRGMLLTWQQEFKKWKVNIDFHNLNESRLSDQETEIAAGFGDQMRDYQKNKDYIRFVKLYAWMKGGGILGIGYRLFEELAGEHAKKRCSEKFMRILLELPGLIVMDEGHTPRNSQSLMWKAVTKIKTQRRVILSGTPFQNNFSELYNTLCLVNPTFSQQIMATSCNGKGNPGRKRKINDAREEWSNLTSYISKKNNVDDDNDDRLKKLRSMIKPFVHTHRGGILQKTLPGIRDCLVILKPTDVQTKLLEKVPSRVDNFLEQVYLASLISVHPSLVAEKQEFSDHKRELKSIESNHNAGVKTRFLINLIQLSIRLQEKVLVFSEFIDPLIHIKKLLKSHFSWKEGREIIYMDGDQSIKQRQCLINCFNEKQGSAKVLLASQRACSEGINLVGASRVVLLDVVWNPSVERQAICRAYRLGQEKMVYVYHLVTSMEEKKYARQAEKERIYKLIFCAGGEGEMEADEKIVSDDKVLEAMVRKESLGCVFKKIVHQPKQNDFVHSFEFVDFK